ncbi:MAG: DNA repair protein RecO [Cyclobacteriaceae bacterium]|nr:DNA repair protein RecO [Cyclobacteriaceae bacterium]
MLHKTPGIVFRFTKFGDTSIIVNVFTEAFGLQSYIVNSVRSASAKGKIALYQPLTLLDMVVYYKENAQVKRMKEVKCLHQYHSLYADVKKSAIAMFIAELLNKTVKDESHAHELYAFIADSLITLDDAGKDFENFHLVFMVKLSRLLGFGAHHLAEVTGHRMMDSSLEALLERLLQAEYTASLSMTVSQRRDLLDALLIFYKDHLDTLGEFKSVPVLKEIFT